MLQTRNAKRPAQAAVRFAVDAVERGAADQGRGDLRRSTPASLDALLHPTFDPSADYEVLARGVGASPGAAKGEIVFTAADAVEAAAERARRDPRAAVHRGRRRRRLPRRAGHPHQRGRQGLARGARRARDGAPGGRAAPRRSRSTSSANGDPRRRHEVVAEGDLIAIDGTTGDVTIDDVPLVGARGRRRTSSRCSRGPTRSARSACAPTPTRRRTPAGARVRRRGHRPVPHRAHVHGRGPPAEDARDDHGRRPRRTARAALDELLPAPAGGLRGPVRGDGGPAGDDPPARPAAARVPARTARGAARARARPRSSARRRRRRSSARSTGCAALEEANPMLGTRGCRLGILYPEIYEMQVEAIMRAAQAVRERIGRGPARRDHDPARRLRAASSS